MPKSKFDSKAESSVFELLPDGDYPFEVVACDFTLSTGAKTRGSDQMELKLAFYRDAKFERKIAQWTETMIFHPNCEWKISVFAKCANVMVGGKAPGDGEEIEWTAGLVLGLRGWATVHSQEGTSERAKAEHKRFNRVLAFITNKEKLERCIAAATTEPQEEYPF